MRGPTTPPCQHDPRRRREHRGYRDGPPGHAVSYGFPAPGAGAGNTTSCPVGSVGSGPPHSWPTTYSCGRSPRLSVHAKAPRSSSTVARTSPPSRTRTQCRLPTSAYQTAPSASTQVPVGVVVLGVRPRSPVGQVAVLTDVVGREPVAAGLGHDQRGAVGGDRHAVGKGEVVRDQADSSLRRDEHHAAGRGLTTRGSRSRCC